MKTFEIRRLLASWVGVALLSGPGVSPAYADFTFGTPTPLRTISSPGGEAGPCVSAEGREFYLDSNRAGGHGNWDLWVATRATADDPWGAPINLGDSVNTSAIDYGPTISTDGLELYYCSNRGSSFDLWVATRATVSGPWGNAVSLGPTVNSPRLDIGPSISTDGLELFFCSDRPGGLSSAGDLWVTTRATTHAPWGNPLCLGAAVNSTSEENSPCISPDGLLLFFESNRSGGYGDFDLWMARRATKNNPWGPAVNLGPSVNTGSPEYVPGLSPDGKQLYFVTAELDILQAPIIPVADFNGDEIVDANDETLLTAHLGQADPNFDIGPMPWGDGKVDANDLEVLKRYLGQDFLNPMPVARWKLDETEAPTAHDSAGDCDGTLHGNPVWQPSSGVKGGALRLDGVDDYVSTEKILDPAAGPFSVFLWVQGGAPNQVILSQAGGGNWLMASPSGTLMTMLPSTGRSASPLTSATIITDGAWHRVGLAWDGAKRTLYVDGVEVAKDSAAQAKLISSTGSLHLGAASVPKTSLFWSGLIDEVRIYDQAVKP